MTRMRKGGDWPLPDSFCRWRVAYNGISRAYPDRPPHERGVPTSGFTLSERWNYQIGVGCGCTA